MKNLFQAIIFICISLNTWAQTNLDSLYAIWQDKSAADSIRLDAFTDYIKKGFLTKKPDTVLILAEELRLFAEKSEYSKAKATAYNLQGISFYFKSNYPSALINYEKSLKIFEEISDRKGVSILFTDFKAFTAASEKLSAQNLVAEINTCFEAFDGLMGKYGIEKIKTIGDAYMAAGGLPVPTDDSVKNTVLAALEMQAFISDRKAKLDAEGKPGFEMRVGVHTGPVVAGIVGVKKFQYDIWGDTVNTASRMESSGEVGRVNISEATHGLLKEDSRFSFESRGKIEAKGKGEMEMFFVDLT